MAINQVLLGALTGIDVPLYGDGSQLREFTYVDDIVTATLAAATADVTAAVVNIGGGTSVRMLDVLDLAHEVTGQPVPILNADPQAGDVAATQADLTLAHRLLGYRPSIGLREGMARQAEWLAGLPDSLRMFLLPNQLEVSR